MGRPILGVNPYLPLLGTIGYPILPQISGHRFNLYYKNLQNLGKWISQPQPHDLSILPLGLGFTDLTPRERFVLPGIYFMALQPSRLKQALRDGFITRLIIANSKYLYIYI